MKKFLGLICAMALLFEMVNMAHAKIQIAAGGRHTVGLKSDGTVVAVGENHNSQCNVGTWTDIGHIIAGEYHTVGLKSDGTVVAVGDNGWDQCEVGSWTDIIQIAAGEFHTVGLKSNGTVVAVGHNGSGQCRTSRWTDICQIAVEWNYTIGLKSDGTVVAVGSNEYGQCNIGSWTDIGQIATGGYHTVGLKSDGTVVAVGNNEYGQCNVGTWTDISQVTTGEHNSHIGLFIPNAFTVGLKSDGTVVAVGFIYDDLYKIGNWTDICQIATGTSHTVGLKSDGTVVAVGWNYVGECRVDSWTDIIQIAAGRYHTVGLKSDGTVVAVGDNDYGQRKVGRWSLMVNMAHEKIQIAAGWKHTVGLKSDGTVVAVGYNSYGQGQCDVDSWTDISEVTAGGYHTVGLISDGTIIAVGDNEHGQCNIGSWTYIIQIAAGWRHTVGLRSNGTVVAVGSNEYGQCRTSRWTDIIQIAAGWRHTVGLKSDGTVVVLWYNYAGQFDVGSWTDIIQIAAGWPHTVGLKSDGTVVAVGYNFAGQCDVGSWTDIIQIATGLEHTVGLKSDGTVVAVGHNGSGQCDVGSWTDISEVTAGGYHTVGLKSDGTVVAVGSNEYGQCHVKGWTLINRQPILKQIGPQQANEGNLLQFTINATDPDEDELTYSAINLPTGASFDPDTQLFSWTPSFTQAGSYEITFTVTDNGTPSLSDEETITITVEDVNGSPELAAIGNRAIDEGVLLQFAITASDPDGDELNYSAINLPPEAIFNSATREFSWTPSFIQTGSYEITFTVTDNGAPSLSDEETITITVQNVNRSPILDSLGGRTVDEGNLLQFTITATAPDGDELIYSASNLPPGASFDSYTREFSWTPNYDQAENYEVTFTVTDNGTPPLTDEETITISVENVNRIPELTPIGNRSIDEGKLLQFTITACDPEGDELTYSASNLPIGASFDPDTQAFNWTPCFIQAGSYEITFTVTDNGAPPLNDEEIITITVQNVNRPPELAPIGNKSVNEGMFLQFTITASDPDGDELISSANNLPDGASFDSNTQKFNWKPNYNQAGSYEVTFTVIDNGTPPLTDSEIITIEVINKRRPSSYDNYYGYGWYSGPYTQGYQHWDRTNYQQQLWNKQILSNWQQPMPQWEQSWPNLSPLWHQQQQQTLYQPFEFQSYKPSLSQLPPFPQPQYQYWDFTAYQQKQPWNDQKSYEQPIFQLEQYLLNLSWDWYEQEQQNWVQPLAWDFTGYQQQVFDLQKQQQLLNFQQKPWNQMFQPSYTWP